MCACKLEPMYDVNSREATPAVELESENQEVPHGRIGARVGEITRVCDLLTTGVDCHDAMRGSPLWPVYIVTP